MIHFKRIFPVFLFFFFLFSSFPLYANPTINVPVDDPVYRAIDRMISVGLIKTAIIGQRPYSRGEVARLMREADQNFESLATPQNKFIFVRLLKYYQQRYASELDALSGSRQKRVEVHTLNFLQSDVTLLDSAPRPVFPNGVGSTDAIVNPLINYRRGRLVDDGFTWAVESAHWLSAPYFAFYAQPRFQVQSGPAGSEDVGAYVQSLYAKTAFKNIEVEVGRDHLAWGQSAHGGLLFSDHSRGLDMLKLSSPSPFRLPWLLGHLGVMKASLILGTMGPEYDRKYAHMSAVKLSVLPASWAEIGFGYSVIMGGEGGPPMNTIDRTREVFGFIPGIGVTNNDFSNKLGGLDVRFRIPPLSGAELYSEFIFDDKNFKNWDAFFTDKMGVLSGLYLPRLGSMDHVALRGEYRHTPAIFYQHSGLLSGYALNRRFLGDPIGPDGDSLSLTGYYDMGADKQFRMAAAFEQYEGNTNSGSANGDIFVSNKGVSEKRWRYTAGWKKYLNKQLMLDAELGVERVSNYNFVQGNSENNFLAAALLRIEFDSIRPFDKWH